MKDSFNNLTYKELVTKKEEMVAKYRQVRFNKVLTHLENPLQLRTMKRAIARLNTLIHEYKLGIRVQEK